MNVLENNIELYRNHYINVYFFQNLHPFVRGPCTVFLQIQEVSNKQISQVDRATILRRHPPNDTSNIAQIPCLAIKRATVANQLEMSLD